MNVLGPLLLASTFLLVQTAPTTYNVYVRPGGMLGPAEPLDLPPNFGRGMQDAAEFGKNVQAAELLRLQAEQVRLQNQQLQDQIEAQRAAAKPVVKKWHVNVRVTSSPPGCPIEINGDRAGTTPAVLKLQVGKVWVGEASVPGGWAYGQQVFEISVLPPPGKPSGLKIQSKQLRPGLSPKGAAMHFDLRAESESPPSAGRAKSGVQEPDVRLRKLKKLFDEGLIDQRDYDRQRKVILSEL